MKATHDALERRSVAGLRSGARSGGKHGSTQTATEIEGTTWTRSDRKRLPSRSTRLPAAPGVDACPALTVRR